MRVLDLFGSLWPLVCTAACPGPGHGTCATPPPLITIADTITGQRICDASITAMAIDGNTSGLVQPSLPLDGDAAHCVYYLEAPIDPYNLTISRTGYDTANVAKFTESSLECKQSPQTLSISLKPH